MARKKQPAPTPMVYDTFPPVTIRNPQPSAEHMAALAESQRAHARALADRIEQGHVLNKIDAQFAAVLIRSAADRIGKGSRRGRGKPRTMDPGTVAMEFGDLVVVQGLSARRAIDRLAFAYQVSEEGVRLALKPNRARVLAWYRSGRPSNSAD